MAKNRGKLPTPAAGKLPEVDEPRSTDDTNPKFCLHYLRDGFNVDALSPKRQAAFARTLQKLACSRWKELKLAPRRGQGFEHIQRAQIKAPIPAKFEDSPKFLIFRYDGKLPMGGVRVRDVYHVLWIEPEFNRLYDHG
jgi:hypothetical protein